MLPVQVRVGNWNSIDRLALAREPKADSSMGEVHPMANKTFVITSILVSILVLPTRFPNVKGSYIFYFHCNIRLERKQNMIKNSLLFDL